MQSLKIRKAKDEQKIGNIEEEWRERDFLNCKLLDYQLCQVEDGEMVTGVNSISGTMSSSSTTGLVSPSSNGNSNGSLNGISLIEPVKRAGDNRRVSVTVNFALNKK